MIIGPISTGAAVGADGAATATGTTTTPVCGLLYAVYVKYNGDKPATTDVTIKTQGTSPRSPSYNILVLTNAVTDGMFYPRADSVTTAGAANGTNDTIIAVDDYLQAVIAGTNTDDYAQVWFFLLS